MLQVGNARSWLLPRAWGRADLACGRFMALPVFAGLDAEWCLEVLTPMQTANQRIQILNYADPPLRRKEGVIARWESEDEILLFDSLTGQIQVVNEAGLITWYLCDGLASRQDVHRRIQAHYSVDRETEEAIDRFLDHMLTIGFIAAEDSPDLTDS